MNLYGYAAGDPINNSDPFGLCPECPTETELVRAYADFAGKLAQFIGLGQLGSAVEGATVRAGTSVARLEGRVAVTHVTSAEGAAAIEASGALRAGSYVAPTAQVAGKSARALERFLEIDKGKGAMSGNLLVRPDVLRTPSGGPVTSGGATQFQVKVPIPIDPGTFVRTP